MEAVKEKTVEELVQEDLAQLLERQGLIDARVAKLVLHHEHLVIIHRYEGLETLTFLETTENMMGARRRQSWYGRIVAISPVDCGDDVIEKKKKHLKPNDVINFNPDSAWSLNIPGFEEIWCLHIDNVIVADTAYDYIAYKNENMRKRMEVRSALARSQFQKAQAALAAREIEEKKKQQSR